jgi:hypothetical protein
MGTNKKQMNTCVQRKTRGKVTDRKFEYFMDMYSTRQKKRHKEYWHSFLIFESPSRTSNNEMH